MLISKLIDAAACAAVESRPLPATDIWLRAAIHDANDELSLAGINDIRLAASVTLAKLETRAEAGTQSRAVQRDITIIKEFLND